MAVDVVGLTP